MVRPVRGIAREARAALGLCILAGVSLFSCAPAPHPPAGQAVYLWQRQWTSAVEQALTQSAGSFDVLMVLAAEFEDGEALVAPRIVAVNWSALAATQKPVWAVLRAHRLPGIDEPGIRKNLAAVFASTAEAAMAKGRSAGVILRGVQLDYDCPTAGLFDYALFMAELRETLPDAVWSITALPDWLNAPAFRDTVRGLDHFVLQVHSLERPANASVPASLCDPKRAKQWIRAAGAVDCPFYVALPTYGYRLHFDAQGDFRAVSAEGGPAQEPGGGTRELSADPEALAALVREAGPALPANARGWVWFRLPVEGDTLNWSWPVLRGVMHGEAPRAQIEAEVRSPSENLYEVWLKNTGAYRPGKPVRVTVRWKGAALDAYDVLNRFYDCETKMANALLLEGIAPLPGNECMALWIRVVPEGQNPVVIEARILEKAP